MASTSDSVLTIVHYLQITRSDGPKNSFCRLRLFLDNSRRGKTIAVAFADPLRALRRPFAISASKSARRQWEQWSASKPTLWNWIRVPGDPVILFRRITELRIVRSAWSIKRMGRRVCAPLFSDKECHSCNSWLGTGSMVIYMVLRIACQGRRVWILLDLTFSLALLSEHRHN